jgi:hypothetical protein
MYFKIFELCMKKKFLTILRSEFILYFSCRVKNAFLTTLLSTTTKIESLPLFDLGKPKTRSIEMSTHGSSVQRGIQAMWLSPRLCFPTSYAFITYTLHIFFHFRPIIMIMLSKVLLTPKCPINPPICFTYKQFTYRT